MTDTDQGSQAANLGGQLQGGQQQGPPPNPWQAGGGPGPNPWREFVNRIRPPQSLPVAPTGMNTGTEDTVPRSDQPQNYIPAPMRDSGWGQPDSILEGAQRYPGVTPGPFMPSGPLQIQQTMRASLAGLANIGSGDVSALAGHSVAWQAAYLKARMQKQEWQARMAREQLLTNNEKLYSTQEKELNAYGEAFVKWKDQPDKLYDELYRIARNGAGSGTPDQGMLDMLNDGDHAKGSLAAAKRLLGYRDVHWLNGRKAGQQIKDEQAEQERERWLPEKQDATTAAPSATAPSPTAPATTAAAPGMPRVPEAPSELIKRSAQDKQMGIKRDPALDPTGEITERRDAYADQLDNYMRSLPVDPTATPEQRRASIMPMVRAGNPAMADRVEARLNGDVPSGAAANTPAEAMADSIARKIDPDYSRTAAAAQAKTKATGELAVTRAIGTDFGKQMQALSTIRRIVPTNIGDMDRLIEQARKIDTTNIPMFERMYREGQLQTGNPEVARFMSLLHKVQLDAGVILTSANTANPGRYTVSAMKMMDQFLDRGATPEQFKAIGDTLKQDYERMLTPLLGETNALKLQLSPKAPEEKADDVYAAIRGGGQQQDLPRPQSIDEAKKLAPGTKFIDPNGVVRTR